MPAQGVPGRKTELPSLEQLAQTALFLLRHTGGHRIKLTGGEPTLRRNLPLLMDRLAGDCIVPRARVFTQVIEGGMLVEGNAVKLEKPIPRITIQAASLTVSDRCSRGETIDTAGPAVAERLAEQLHAHIAWTGIVPDEPDQIAAALSDLCSRGIDLVVTAGGTGCMPRDVTPEATRRVIERELPGLAEKMRLESAKITPNAWLQRGVCGMRGNTLILNLPGSRIAALENLEAVIGLIPAALDHIRGTAVHAESENRAVISRSEAYRAENRNRKMS